MISANIIHFVKISTDATACGDPHFTTIAASGEVMDDDQVDPAFCRNGSATWAAVAENDVSSKLTVSATSNVAGQRTDLELSIPSLPVDLPERSYILIYLPRSFVASTNYSLPDRRNLFSVLYHGCRE